MRSGDAIHDAVEIKKRGGELSEEIIASVVAGYTEGSIPDYQMSALLMAIFIQGMEYGETLALTRAMADSGKRFYFPECVDKHSTGGVGDKVSLTALPIVAACGAPVAKLSGRGLGTTGGTIDKLEAIPGFHFAISEDRFRRQVDEVGLAILEAGDLAPADKAIYALRDTTGTVDSLPLIGSSIVSKKAATGAGYLLYDVKAGSGAFMKDLDGARELAALLVRLSRDLDIHASALITDMDNPLGSAIGNALEVRESVAFLKGEATPRDLAEVARAVAVRLLELKEFSDPEGRVEDALASGAAFEKFREFVRAQGGDPDALDDLPVSASVRDIVAPTDGYVSRLHALPIARAALELGAGRKRKTDSIDYAAGVELLRKTGDPVQRGEPVARLHGERNAERAERFMAEAIEVSESLVEHPPSILEVVT